MLNLLLVNLNPFSEIPGTLLLLVAIVIIYFYLYSISHTGGSDDRHSGDTYHDDNWTDGLDHYC